MEEKKAPAPPDTLSCRMDLAKAYGVDVAIFLHYLQFWVKTNKASRHNFRQGRYWSYGSTQFFSEMFPCWSAKQIRRIIETCKGKELILTGNFNGSKRDRTVWYTLSDEMLAAYGIEANSHLGECICPDGQMDMPESVDGFAQDEMLAAYGIEGPAQTGSCICPDGQMAVPERADGFAQKGEPLPVSYPVSYPVDTPIAPLERKTKREAAEAMFQQLWEAYPQNRKQKRKSALDYWLKLTVDEALFQRILLALEAQKKSYDWTKENGQYIPMAATWIHQRRWEDELPTPPDKPPAEEAFGWN